MRGGRPRYPSAAGREAHCHLWGVSRHWILGSGKALPFVSKPILSRNSPVFTGRDVITGIYFMLKEAGRETT